MTLRDFTYRSTAFIGAMLFCLTLSSYAQESPSIKLDPQKAITQYAHTAFTTKNGLPQNTISAIVQTNDGYLWLATQEGLVRFDGVQFTVFDSKNSDFIPVNTINQLVIDSDGVLWIGTRGGGVLSYSSGTFTTYSEDEGLSSNYVTALYVDTNNRVWAGTLNIDNKVGVLNRIESGVITQFGAEQGLEGGSISFVSHDASNRLLVGTKYSGVLYLSESGFLPHPNTELASAYATAFFLDSNKNEWFGLLDGTVLKQAGGQLFDLSDQFEGLSGYLKQVVEDRSGSLWFGSKDAGLFRLANGRVSRYHEGQGLSSNSVLSLLEGREGELWLGTQNGLDKLQNGKFTTFSEAEGLSSDQVLSIHEDSKGAIWSATRGGGVNRLFEGEIKTFNTDNGLSSNVVHSVISDLNGDIWIGTAGNGVDRITPSGIVHYSQKNGLVGDEIFALHLDLEGNVWIGTLTGVSIYDGRSFTSITMDDGLSSPFITDFADRAEGGMWIGTYDGGVDLLENGSITNFNTENGLFSDGVLALYEDADGTLWVGTYGSGLNQIRKGIVTGISAKEGLFDDTIFSIEEDDHGRLWFSSNKGIFYVSKKGIEDVISGKEATVENVHYGVFDGLKSAEMNGGQQPASWKGSDGTIWYPTVAGFAGIQSNHIPSNTVKPLVAIRGLIVDRKSVELGSEITLAAGSDKLEFRLAGLSFRAPELTQYEVKLEGHDSEWNDLGTRREAFYTNLGPGSYTLLARATNEDGVESEAVAEVTFTIKPFFYQTIWFLVFCLGASVVAVFGFSHFRMRQIKERARVLELTVEERTADLRKEKEITERAKEVIEKQAAQLKELDKFKTKFFSNVSHEFRTPLTMLIGPLENALSGLYGTFSDSMRQQTEIMLRNAQRLMRLINQLMDLSKLEAGKMQLKARGRNVVPFLEGMLYTFTPFAEKKNIDLTFESNEDDIEVYFEPDHLEKVFFNLLSNAAKFTPVGGSISINVFAKEAEAAYPNGAVCVVITDTGSGMPPEDLPLIFDRFKQSEGAQSNDQQGTGIGLSLVKELVVLHKGDITVESEVGKGTAFSIWLHLGQAHLNEDEIISEDDVEAESSAFSEFSSNSLSFVHEDEPAVLNVQSVLPDDAPVVLIVEDNKDVREYVASILQSTYRIVEASDGAEGLEKTVLISPDLVISDVTMPVMDGTEMCRRIKTDKRTDHIPVLLLTARASFEGKISGLEVGADDYMAKPFNAQELLIRVRNLIKIRAQDKELKVLNEDLEQEVQRQIQVVLKEREKYEKELIIERDRAETSSRIKSSILDNINHEFRTPLSTILGYSQIMKEEAPGEMAEFADAIEKGGQRLLKTLNGVIDLANLEATDFETNKSNVCLLPIVQDAINSVESEAVQKGLEISFETNLSEHSELLVSPIAVQKVLNALLDNAVKFTAKGRVIVSVMENARGVNIQIKDTGVGIDPKVIGQIFNPFMQSDTGSLARTHEGCGVGLTIASRLVEKMGGSLSVSSQPGSGSCFEFELRKSNDRDSSPTKSNRVVNRGVGRSV
ncbi:response regulator [bacterium]|nr:response regulator [bacterium]